MTSSILKLIGSLLASKEAVKALKVLLLAIGAAWAGYKYKKTKASKDRAKFEIKVRKIQEKVEGKYAEEVDNNLIDFLNKP